MAAIASDELMAELERTVRAKLGRTGQMLCDLADARHEAALVASPILQTSPKLSDNERVEIAARRGAAHGLAIAQRRAAHGPLNLPASQRMIRFGSICDFAQRFRRGDTTTGESR